MAPPVSIRGLLTYATNLFSQVPLHLSDVPSPLSILGSGPSSPSSDVAQQHQQPGITPYVPLTGAPSCPLDGPISCNNKTAGDSCCFVYPGGRLLLTQFWDEVVHVGGSEEDWTLHGLWPDLCDGSYDQYCGMAPRFNNITEVLKHYGQDELLGFMNRYWVAKYGGNAHLWAHEYNKHATCINTLAPSCYGDSYSAGLEVVDYFVRAFGLFRMLDTYVALQQAGIEPDHDKTYDLDLIRNTLEDFSGGKVVLHCTGRRHDRLHEAWYVYFVQGSLQSGEFVPAKDSFKGDKSNCAQKVRRLSNTTVMAYAPANAQSYRRPPAPPPLRTRWPRKTTVSVTKAWSSALKPSMDSNDSFVLFRWLPETIRNRIWDLCFPPSRVQLTNSLDSGNLPFVNKFPAVAYSCKEGYNAAKRRYPTEAIDVRLRTSRSSVQSRQSRYNPSKDIVLLGFNSQCLAWYLEITPRYSCVDINQEKIAVIEKVLGHSVFRAGLLPGGQLNKVQCIYVPTAVVEITPDMNDYERWEALVGVGHRKEDAVGIFDLAQRETFLILEEAASRYDEAALDAQPVGITPHIRLYHKILYARAAAYDSKFALINTAVKREPNMTIRHQLYWKLVRILRPALAIIIKYPPAPTK
ncbi:uncharacterized protein JN550_008515 [Neoarthrinium moseri]|uniref:uncharacterized protein n=1 Tax=Neoarthrinium moseri TaxID=1658444 RepID=UPI001FDBA4E2|nr:uncharacterized protein JN550_008515 [Neoarthrinium moseri]KAI1864969.1 hypothetical protein JN550_008515 [Neoarthrinium moseri]